MGPEEKLAVRLGDSNLAHVLVQAGMKLPSQIRKATDAELKKIGLDTAVVTHLRKRLPRGK